ncbi:hypothetical protein DXG01_015614 [Tephrocybe rancida]|nr:hypothetical protein DXG01_015614 [Tephrocybe rancida]
MVEIDVATTYGALLVGASAAFAYVTGASSLLARPRRLESAQVERDRGAAMYRVLQGLSGRYVNCGTRTRNVALSAPED